MNVEELKAKLRLEDKEKKEFGRILYSMVYSMNEEKKGWSKLEWRG